MAQIQETAVLIIGGGPTGLALAADLTTKGIPSIVVETRTDVTAHPRATLLGSRSMELYRRLDRLDRKILDAALPREFGYEVVFTTSLSKEALYYHRSPSPNEYEAAHAQMRTDLPESAWTPYFKVQIGQHALEPVVKGWIEEKGLAQLYYGWEYESFEQDQDGVTSIIRNIETGETRTIRSRFLVGADGGRSKIRLQLDIPYVGRGAMRRNVSFLFRSPEFSQHAKVGRFNLCFMFKPGAFGVFTNINDVDTWNYQHYLLNPSEDPSSLDPETEIRNAMGHDFPFEIIQVLKWSHHQSVAERYRKGNVFLAGDSAHLFCPTGGVGMNTGIGDAFDLGWKLAAVLQGWGGEGLLESYEWERRPIGFRNTIAAASNADRIDAMMKTTTTALDEQTAQGDEARAFYARRLRWLAKQFNSAGTHLGYRYAESPIIVADGTPEPPDDLRVVVQSTWPGCRAPHIWLAPGRSTLDWYDGCHFVMVNTSDTEETNGMTEVAAELGIPYTTVACNDPRVAHLYEKPFVLVRPDGHVCWRGDAAPVNARAVWEHVTGIKSIL